MKKTIIDLFENSVKQYPDNPFLWEKTRDAFEPTTYKEVQQQVYAAGAGLIALGVKKGDNMALLSEGRNAWIIGELAMFYAGAINVPLSIKLEEANDLLFRLVHADVKYILVSGNQLKKIRAIMDKLPLVEKIIVIDELPEYKEKEISWSEVFRMGKEYLASHSLEDFLAVGQSLQNNDITPPVVLPAPGGPRPAAPAAATGYSSPRTGCGGFLLRLWQSCPPRPLFPVKTIVPASSYA